MKHNRQFKYLFFPGAVLIAGLLLTACGSATKNKTFTIGVVNPSFHLETSVRSFKEGMRALGYVEGKNVTYIYEGPVGTDRLDAIAQGLVKQKVSLILALTTPATKAAKRATEGTAIPVVFIPVTDPVGDRIVDSLIKPGGHITGVTHTSQEGKRLEWLLRVKPTIKQVYFVYNPKEQSPIQALKMASMAATELGVKLIAREVSTTDEAMAAFRNTPKEADAIFLPPDIAVNAHAGDAYKLAIELGLPTSGPNLAAVNDGALTTYGVDLAFAARKQAARLASQILQGAKPADLPVEMAQYFSAINLRTARALGLDVPIDILRQANTIIR